ncbi:MAG: peptidylprolyl isomerase [Pseudomonadales bacterium]|nr:peptidylprolyl isomerase [Pseudomonadales bacterium]
MFKDPLWLFLLFGTLLFGLARWQDDARVIQVSNGDIQRLSLQWQQQMRREPTDAERQNLIAQFTRDEAYYQEALRLGLDADDTIVRRRLIQKVTFLTEDLAATETPDPQTLEQFYDNNRQRYEIPEQFTFQHIYFSSDRDAGTSNGSAKTMATKAVSNPALTGDPFMLQSQYARRSQREIGDLFGRAFAERLIAIETLGKWQGPIQSAYGWHAVLLENRRPVQGLPYQQVKDKVLLDWRQERRVEANKAYLAGLLDTYEVQMPEAYNAASESAVK